MGDKGKRAKAQDIEHMRQTYKELKDIAETARVTGWSKTTVHKYVQDLSQKKPNSPYNKRVIMLRTGKRNIEFDSVRETSIVTGIYTSSISQCLSGRTVTAGGFKWKFKNQRRLWKRSAQRRNIYQISVRYLLTNLILNNA